MSIGKRLKALRKNKKMKQDTLANTIGINRATISMYERDKRTPSPEILKKYSDIFDVSIDYIMGKSLNFKESKDYVRINIYANNHDGIPVEKPENIEYTQDLSFSDGYSPDKKYIGIKVKDDYMYPKYIENDTIIIEKTDYYENGKDVAVCVNNNIELRNLYYDKHSIILKPFNPEYPPKKYSFKNENNIINIIGVVVELRRKI